MKQIRLLSLLFFMNLWVIQLTAQSDSLWQKAPVLQLSGFADVFYAYDFNQPQTVQRQPFLFNHNRHNAVNLNLAYIKLGLTHTKYRANLALHAGSYVNDNYAAEQAALSQLFEANVGMALNKANTLWLDAGIFSSHIGFESAISMDNQTLTRSLLAENSPYFLSGAKLTYNPSERWEMAFLVLNGWQRIQPVPGNSLLSLGTQLRWKLSDQSLLNWSSFIGTNDPDSTRRLRYFNNFYGQFQLTEKLALTAGFDIGLQQQNKGSRSYQFWYSPVLIGQLVMNSQWKVAARLEYYQDDQNLIIPTPAALNFRTMGYSVNVDYAPVARFLCRLEGRLMNSADAVFLRDDLATRSNFVLATSAAVKF